MRLTVLTSVVLADSSTSCIAGIYRVRESPKALRRQTWKTLVIYTVENRCESVYGCRRYCACLNQVLEFVARARANNICMRIRVRRLICEAVVPNKSS